MLKGTFQLAALGLVVAMIFPQHTGAVIGDFTRGYKAGERNVSEPRGMWAVEWAGYHIGNRVYYIHVGHGKGLQGLHPPRP